MDFSLACDGDEDDFDVFDLAIHESNNQLLLDEFNLNSVPILGDWLNDVLLPSVCINPELLMAFRSHPNWYTLSEVVDDVNQCQNNLLKAFNQMAQQINAAFDGKEAYNPELYNVLNHWLTPTDKELQSIVNALKHNMLFDVEDLILKCMEDHDIPNTLMYIYSKYIVTQ